MAVFSDPQGEVKRHSLLLTAPCRERHDIRRAIQR